MVKLRGFPEAFDRAPATPDPSNGEMDSSWMALRHRCAKLSFAITAKALPEGVHNALYDYRG